jgi:DNA polymerase sigma
MVMVGTHSGLRLGMSGQLSFDLSVSSPVPPFVKVLVDACAKMDSRALDLIYLVRRWAKIRGLCFAPRGYLPPYLWTIMTIFFLQVRQRGEGAVLPPLKIAKGSWGFSVTSRLPRWKEPDAEKASHTAHSTSTGELLKEFFNFYAKEFDGTAEVISMTAGKRDASATARMRLPAQVIYHEDGVQQTVALTIEDPLNNQRALRTPVTWTSLARITEELSRAATLSEREQDCSAFVDLLQLWNGGENDQENDEDDQDNDGLQ